MRRSKWSKEKKENYRKRPVVWYRNKRHGRIIATKAFGFRDFEKLTTDEFLAEYIHPKYRVVCEYSVGDSIEREIIDLQEFIKVVEFGLNSLICFTFTIHVVYDEDLGHILLIEDFYRYLREAYKEFSKKFQIHI